jgi:hypothetical protein
MVVGSPEYTAPERLRGTDGLSASDLFSLGATLFQAVEGSSPFRRDTPTATLSAVLLDHAPALRRAGPLTQAITRLLDKDPATRPTVSEALAMARVSADESTVPVQVRTGVVPRRTEIIATRGKPMGWHKVVEVLMALVAMFGIVGFMGPNFIQGWGILPYAMRFGVIIDALLAGVLCVGIVRLVPASADRIVSVFFGVAGFLVGAGVAGVAVMDFFGYMFVQVYEGAVTRYAARDAMIVITIGLLVAVGWAWVFRKWRNGAATRA